MSQILLYYKYVQIKNPIAFQILQKTWCQSLGLKGRIIISEEGINGTVEGSVENTEMYIQKMTKLQDFENIHWKKSVGTKDAFEKLSVKVKKEIVASLVKDLNPTKKTGKYLDPKELKNWFILGKKFYIVDMRNMYEFEAGHFEGSILPTQLKHFRDLPKILPSIEHLKNETILSVCTGGVRCEKASGFLLENGFGDVWQLAGGIVSYMELFPNQDFLGKLYVFDNRLLMGFNLDSKEHKVVGKCRICGASNENFVDYWDKNKRRSHGIICQNCIDKKEVRLDSKNKISF